MFRKIAGTLGALAVVGVVVMVALSPRPAGLFPDRFDFLRWGARGESSVPVSETPAPAIEPAEYAPAPGSASQPLHPRPGTVVAPETADTLSVEKVRRDTILIEP